MKKLVPVILIVLVAMSCNSLKVIHDLDKTVDFSEFKTIEFYGWAEKSDSVISPFEKERIENATAVEFENRALNIVERGSGDLVVALYVVTKQKKQTTATTNHHGYGGYYGYGPGYGWGSGQSYTTVNEYEYTVGTIVISVYDAKDKKLIWEGIGSGTVNESSKNREIRTNRTIAKIMYKYPTKPIKK